MGISTRSSRRLAEKSAGAGASSPAPAPPAGAIRKAVRKGVSKAKAAAARAAASAAKVRSPRKKIAPAADSLAEFPHVSIIDHAGAAVDTKLVAEEGAFVVFLYPRANTPGCTNQACGFRDGTEELASLGYRAFGLSYDSPKSQSNWRDKHTLPYPLWCDTPASGLIKALGAHKAPKSVKRSHFVVAKGGAIVDAHVQISPKNSVALALQYARDHPATADDPAAKGDAPVADPADDDAMDVEPAATEGATESVKVDKKAETDAVMEDAAPAKAAAEDAGATKEEEAPKVGKKKTGKTKGAEEHASKDVPKVSTAAKDVIKEAAEGKENVEMAETKAVDAMDTGKTAEKDDTKVSVVATESSAVTEAPEVSKKIADGDGADKAMEDKTEPSATKNRIDVQKKTDTVPKSTTENAPNEGATSKEGGKKESTKKDGPKEDSTAPTAEHATVADKIADSAAAVPLASS